MNGTENKRAFVFMGGKHFFPERMTDIPHDDDMIIAADSGCRALEEFCAGVKKISPHIILGDMDSFDFEKSRKAFPNAEFLTFPAKKDYTDTALAVDAALDRGCKTIVIAGGVGGRIDHTLAVIFLLEHIKRREAKGIVTDGKNRMYLAEKENIIHKGRKYISLIPLDEKVYGVRMDENFVYPFESKELSRAEFPTISNELSEDAGRISLAGGTALIVETED